MTAECPECKASYEIDPEKLPAPKIRLRCSQCSHVFGFALPARALINPPIEKETEKIAPSMPTFGGPTPHDVRVSELEEAEEGEVVDVEEVSQEISIARYSQEDRTETVILGPKFLKWTAIVASSFILGGIGYLLVQERPSASRPASTPQPESRATPLVEKPTSPIPAAAETASEVVASVADKLQETKSDLLDLLEQAKEQGSPSIDAGEITPPKEVEETRTEIAAEAPKAELKNAEIVALQNEFKTFTPTNLGKLRNKIATLMPSIGEQADLGFMSAEIHAYLGKRENRREWISYAHQAAFHWAQRNPSDPRGNEALAMAYLAAGQPKKALKYARKAAGELAGNPTTEYVLAVATQKGFSRAKGRALLEKAYAQHPKFFPLGEALAQTYLKEGKYKKAATLGEKMRQIEPNDLLLTRLLAEAYEGQGNWKKAATYLATVSTRDEAWSVKLSLGRAYRKLKEYEKARAALDKILGSRNLTLSHKERSQVSLERGKVDFDQAKYSESIVYLNEAHRKNPSDLSTMQYFAGALFRVQRFTEAAKVYERATLADPENLSIRRYLGMSYLEGGNIKQAEKVFRGLILEGEEDAPLNYHLARIREMQDDEPGAISFLQRALAIDPNYTNARIRLDKLRAN